MARGPRPGARRRRAQGGRPGGTLPLHYGTLCDFEPNPLPKTTHGDLLREIFASHPTWMRRAN
jgi:hypothetical protein